MPSLFILKTAARLREINHLGAVLLNNTCWYGMFEMVK